MMTATGVTTTAIKAAMMSPANIVMRGMVVLMVRRTILRIVRVMMRGTRMIHLAKNWKPTTRTIP